MNWGYIIVADTQLGYKDREKRKKKKHIKKIYSLPEVFDS